MTVAGIVERLLRGDPAQAVGWLDRFKRPADAVAQSYRSRVAVRLADRDLPQAVRLAEGTADPVYRGLALARLATAVPKSDPKSAHALIEKAAEAVAADARSVEYGPEHRMGLAVYLLWQAQAVAYPDMPSLVAVALTTRPPVPA